MPFAGDSKDPRFVAAHYRQIRRLRSSRHTFCAETGVIVKPDALFLAPTLLARLVLNSCLSSSTSSTRHPNSKTLFSYPSQHCARLKGSSNLAGPAILKVPKFRSITFSIAL